MEPWGSRGDGAGLRKSYDATADAANDSPFLAKFYLRGMEAPPPDCAPTTP